MDPKLLEMFQKQVAAQCRCLLWAAEDVNKGLQKFPPQKSDIGQIGRNVEYVFYALQNLLNAGANISKALWGQGGTHTDTRKPLRDSIGIDDDSPFSNRKMRNHFEHFDERLEEWWERSPRHHVVDRYLGADKFVGYDDNPDRFREFDPDTGDIRFWGEAFNLQKLVDEAQRILSKLEHEEFRQNFAPLIQHFERMAAGPPDEKTNPDKP